MMDLGLLVLRLILGLTMAGHGAQKLFGWFGGYGIAGTGGWLESIGMKPGKFMAFLGGFGEFAGGLLLAVGFWSPLAGLLVAATMLVAIVKVHAAKGFWAGGGGYEYNLLIIAGAVALALIGPGAYSLTSLLS